MILLNQIELTILKSNHTKLIVSKLTWIAKKSCRNGKIKTDCITFILNGFDDTSTPEESCCTVQRLIKIIFGTINLLFVGNTPIFLDKTSERPETFSWPKVRF